LARNRAAVRPKTSQNAMRAETNFTSRFNLIWVVQMRREK
jgi:hypothetical protein